MFKPIAVTLRSVSSAAAGAGLQPSREIAPNLPVERDASGLPVGFSREIDIDLPSKLYSTWKAEYAPRALVRELAPLERLKLEGRAAALEIALLPFDPDTEKNAVEAEIAAMFSGFRAMRQQGDDVAAVVEVTRRVLREFPCWAIANACLLIAQNQARVDGKRLDRRYTPNDTEIYTVTAGVVKLRRDALNSAHALLAAPIEPPEPHVDLAVRYSAAEELRLAHGIPPEGLPRREVVLPPSAGQTTDAPVPRRSDGKHALRVSEELAQRRASRESAAQVCGND